MVETPRKTTTLNTLRRKKAKGERITCIGVYDAPMAAIADRVGFDLMIVGNAGPMSLLGHADPTTVTFEEQLYLTRAVSRVTRYGMVVGQLPFLSYHASGEQAVESAGRFVREGYADVVKCEGGIHLEAHIAAIVRAGIPVVGHIGVQASRRTEQSGFGIKGRTAEEARDVVQDAKAFLRAGAFALIAEQIPTELAAFLSHTLPVPVITQGGGQVNDGVYNISGDLVGYSAFPIPKSRGVYANVGTIIEEAMTRYRDDVVSRAYPTAETDFHMDKEEFRTFLKLMEEK
jgi:3-methyl-2-oxobutanoate hydroxymethyltransferase